MNDVDLDYLKQLAGDSPRRGGSPGRGRRRRGRRRRRRKGRVVAPFLAAVFLITIVGGGGYVGYVALHDFMIPPDYVGQGSGEVTVQVKQGDSATSIGGRLEAAGVVKSARAFAKAAKSNPQAANIQPGFYRMHQHMSAQAALTLLLSPSALSDRRITIPEGLRAAQTMQALSRKTGIPVSEFQKAAANTASLGLPSYANGKIEGFLFPATYDLDPNASAGVILKMMVDRFNKVAHDIGLEARARHANISPSDAIIIASLIQAEGGRKSDFRKISRVIYNRQSRHMELEFDSTVMYALNKYGIVATNKDLETPSPYNTYKFAGLPPGAISNPGELALDAAFSPEPGKWLFFVTTDPKTHTTKFAETHKQFEKYRKELQQNMAKGG